MAANYEVPDSTDWTDTSIPLFASVDASLRCQVCKDFYDAAVITNCAHTFCSSCIRRAIAADGKCPACRTNASEHSLRRNVAIQEVVDAFQAARHQALDVARAHKQGEENTEQPRRGAKRKRKSTEEQPTTNGSVRTRSQRKRAKTDTDGAADAVMVDDSEAEEEASVYEQSQEVPAQPEDGLVSCPMCNRRMKEEEVFGHLDKCDGTPEKATNGKKGRQASSTRSRTSTPLQPQQPSRPPPERLPQLSYSLLKERDLREKLKQLGIPSWGSKDLIIRRHKEWVNIVNSNHDSLRPRQKKELLNELDTWERTQGGNAKIGFTNSGDVMKKDFDGAGWMKSNKTDFDDLIANARKGRQKALEKKAEDESKEVPEQSHSTNNRAGPHAIANDAADEIEAPIPQPAALLADAAPEHVDNPAAGDVMISGPPSQAPLQPEPAARASDRPNPQQPHEQPHPRRTNLQASVSQPTHHRRLPSLQSQISHPESTSHNPSERTQYRRTSSSSPVPGFSVPSHNNGQQGRHDQRMLNETNSQMHPPQPGPRRESSNHEAMTAHYPGQIEANIISYDVDAAGPAGHLFRTASAKDAPEDAANPGQDADQRRGSRSELQGPDAIDGRVKKRPMFDASREMEELEPRG